MEKIENKIVCQKCGGYCCKKSGCDYYPLDFVSYKADYLEEEIKKGFISIVALLKFSDDHGQKTVRPFLYLRARNKGRGPVDLVSYKKTCASLDTDGCRFDYDNRPSGGKHLVPSAKGHFYCYPDVDPLKEVLKWRNYQNVLRTLVERFTGKDLQSQLSSDIENLFYDYLTNNNEDVAIEEKMDIEGMIPLLKETHPLEYQKVRDYIESNKTQKLLKLDK